MRALIYAILLTMLAQPVWAGLTLEKYNNALIGASTENALTKIFRFCNIHVGSGISELSPKCSCALKHHTEITNFGFKLWYNDCIDKATK